MLKRFTKIDDLLTLNKTFSKAIIYPVELTLKRTMESCTVVSYLDIWLVTTVYDKRDSFDFHSNNQRNRHMAYI